LKKITSKPVIAQTPIPQTIPQSTKLKPIKRVTINKSYSLIKTGETIESPTLNVEFDEWKFNSNAKSNVGRFVLLKRDGIDCIWDFKHKNQGIPLTEGLEEILFNDANQLNKIDEEDIKAWQYLINSAGLESEYHSTHLYKTLVDNPFKSFILESKPIVEEVGDGLNFCDTVIPSDPNELRKELALQFAAKQAGHKLTFNYANALMKELLKQKQMTVKEYRDILKNIYEV
jgi:hypothetical protein